MKNNILKQVLLASLIALQASSVSAKLIEVQSDSQLSDIVRSQKGKGPLVIEFFATWCHACQMMNPIIKKLAQVYGNQVTFVQANIDYAKRSAENFGASSIPTIILISKSGERKTLVGATSESNLKSNIAEIIE